MKEYIIKISSLFISSFVFISNGFSQEINEYKDGYLQICENETVWATSTLKGPKNDRSKYSEFNLIDNDTNTAWVEGEKDAGIGVKVIFEIPTSGYSKDKKGGAGTMVIHNGYVKSAETFSANNRVRECTLEIVVAVDSGEYENTCSWHKLKKYKEYRMEFRDTMKSQKYYLNIDYKATKELWRKTKDDMRSKGEKISESEYGLYLFGILTIKSVYKGAKYNDTCISGIGFQ